MFIFLTQSLCYESKIRHLVSVFSIMWISVHITNSGNAIMFKTFISPSKQNIHISFRESEDLDPAATGQTDSRLVQAKFPLLHIRKVYCVVWLCDISCILTFKMPYHQKNPYNHSHSNSYKRKHLVGACLWF